MFGNKDIAEQGLLRKEGGRKSYPLAPYLGSNPTKSLRHNGNRFKVWLTTDRASSPACHLRGINRFSLQKNTTTLVGERLILEDKVQVICSEAQNDKSLMNVTLHQALSCFGFGCLLLSNFLDCVTNHNAKIIKNI